MASNVIVVFVPETFTVSREMYAASVMRMSELDLPRTILPGLGDKMVKVSLSNALPPRSYVHSKVTLSPSTTRSGFGGAAVIFGVCDSMKERTLSSVVINYHPSAIKQSISASGQRQSRSKRIET